jgi:hypothetical protein
MYNTKHIFIYIDVGEPYIDAQRMQTHHQKCLKCHKASPTPLFSAGTTRSALSSAGAKGIGEGEEILLGR